MNPTHYGIEPNRGPKRPAKATPGYAAGNLEVTRLTSVKGLRTSDLESGTWVNVKTAVGISAGGADARFGIPSDRCKDVPALGSKRGGHAKRRAAKAQRILAGKR